jgi:hypothetical protein
MPSHPTLTGSWSGAYRYPGDAMPETVFTAQIEERDGAFTGTTQEPNLLGLTDDAIVSADIDGVRNGLDVRFSKFANGSGGLRHVILYEGQANAALTRIDGRWRIPGDWAGTFFMTRDDFGAEEAVEREAEASLERQQGAR